MKLTKWEFVGVFLIAGLGVFLHYIYEMSDYNRYVAMFAPINESIWEHLKMPFYGMIGYALFEYIFIGEKLKNFIFAKAFSTILACFLVIVLYYGYTNFLDPNIYLDGVIFIIAILIAQIFSYAILRSKLLIKGINYWSLIILILGIITFTSYTYSPPQDNNIFIENLNHNKD